MSPPRRKRSSSGSNVGTGPVTARAASCSSVKPASQTRAHSCSSHRPMTFLSRRIVPSTPRSLVSAGSENTGLGSSSPSSDQVPLDRIAECSSRSGVAA